MPLSAYPEGAERVEHRPHVQKKKSNQLRKKINAGLMIQ